MSAAEYVEYVFLNFAGSGDFDARACNKWILEEDLKYMFVWGFEESLRLRGYISRGAYRDIVDRHWAALKDVGAMSFEGDAYTGVHAMCHVQPKDSYVRQALSRHPVSRRIATLGEGALNRALSVLASEEGWIKVDDASVGTLPKIELDYEGEPTFQVEQNAPASDRIVSFSDNQIAELEKGATAIIEAVHAQNQIADEPGIRELILGQLKAGRELIRAGSFRLYLMEIALLDSLKFLAKRYENEAIGAIAATLIAALAKHIGIDA